MAHNLPFENRNGTIYISTAARQQIQFSAAETESLEKDSLKLGQLKLFGYLHVKKWCPVDLREAIPVKMSQSYGHFPYPP